jgi:hypothetical protein
MVGVLAGAAVAVTASNMTARAVGNVRRIGIGLSFEMLSFALDQRTPVKKSSRVSRLLV